MNQRVFRRVAPILVLALLIAACQTTSTRMPRYTAWKPLTAEESGVRFVGPDAPEISKMQTRWLHGRVKVEQIIMATDSSAFPSEVRVSGAQIAFTDKASKDFWVPERVRQSAVERCSGAEIGEAVTTENSNGSFVYVTCRPAGGDLCVRARQGFREVEVGGPDPNYFVMVDFLYCSASESEAQILERFASVRVKE